MKQTHDMWTAIREPGDLEKKVFASTDEMVLELDPTDINYISERYAVMMADFSPDLHDVTEEELSELKKYSRKSV